MLASNTDNTFLLKRYYNRYVLVYITNEKIRKTIFNDIVRCMVWEGLSPLKTRILDNCFDEKYMILVYSYDKWDDLIQYFQKSNTYKDISKESFTTKGMKTNREFSI